MTHEEIISAIESMTILELNDLGLRRQESVSLK